MGVAGAARGRLPCRARARVVRAHLHAYQRAHPGHRPPFPDQPVRPQVRRGHRQQSREDRRRGQPGRHAALQGEQGRLHDPQRDPHGARGRGLRLAHAHARRHGGGGAGRRAAAGAHVLAQFLQPPRVPRLRRPEHADRRARAPRDEPRQRKRADAEKPWLADRRQDHSGGLHPLLAPEPILRSAAGGAGREAADSVEGSLRAVLPDRRGVPHGPGALGAARVRFHPQKNRHQGYVLQELDMTKRIEAVNDFVVKFANVNGSGSASANELFAKSFLRMGIPVSPRNIFPSNIQGLPTWYEVRVTEKGPLGRRGGVDLMVAMNPQTWEQDVNEIDPGGYLFYDSTKPLPPSKFRDDINVIGLPLTEISNATYTDARERQLFKNIIYVGALAGLMGIEPEVIAELIGEQYKGKEKLLKPNLNALQLGLNYARQNLKGALGLQVKRAYNVGDKIFIDGNAAAALGAVYGGATVCAWYPITPSSSLAEAFQFYCSKMRVDKATGKNKFAIIQAEDELASIGIVTGAGWNGARAFTATSGPGISLMAEFVGLAYFAEIPAVIIDVQRGGPSTGMPTRTQQSDVLKCAY